jgi:hypothetical protein
MPPRPVTVQHFRPHRRDPVRVDRDAGQRVCDGCHHLEADPAAAHPRHLVGVPAEVHDILDAAGHQHRHSCVVERDLAGVRQRGRLRCRVVAGRDEDSATPAGPVQVRLPEHVAGSVHARGLAIPHADDAVEILERGQPILLTAPDGGRRDVLVHAGHVPHLVLGQQRAGPLQRQVESAQRRSWIPADERPGREPRSPVRPDLVEQHPDQCLDAGQHDFAAEYPVLRLEGEFPVSHGSSPVLRPR